MTAERDNRTKILFVQPKAELGGSDLCMLELLKLIDSSRFMPFLLLPDRGPLFGEFGRYAQKIFVHRLSILRSPGGLRGMYDILSSFIPTVRLIRKIIRDEGIDLVYANSIVIPASLVAARLSGVSSICHKREMIVSHRVVAFLLDILSLSLSKKMIAVSEAVREDTALRSRKIKVIYDGLIIDDFLGKRKARSDLRTSIGLAPDTFVVGMIGRIVPWKGLEDLIEAASLVVERGRNVRFVVVGDIPDDRFKFFKEMLLDKIKRCGLEKTVIFTGPTRDVRDYLGIFDILVLPSRDPEPFGRVVLEAMLSKVPVIVTDQGGAVEIIDDGCGFKVPPKNPQRLAEAIVEAQAKGKELGSMGEKGFLRANRLFSLKENIRNIEALIDKVARK